MVTYLWIVGSEALPSMSKNDLVAKTSAKQTPPHVKSISFQTFVYRVYVTDSKMSHTAGIANEIMANSMCQ